MRNIVLNSLAVLVFFCCIYVIGCSSGEYDVDTYTVTYNEKTIKADTIRRFVTEDTIISDRTNPDENDKLARYSFVVQIGAFVVQSNCEKFYQRAKEVLGPEVYFEFQNSLYKIRIGYYTNRADAILMLDKVLGLGYTDAFVVTKKIN